MTGILRHGFFRVNIKYLEDALQRGTAPGEPGRGRCYQRITTDPQANPPPIASATRRSPGLILPCSTPTERASGIDAAVKTLGQAPFGKFLLILAALGLAAYGAYSFVRSRYNRM